MRQHRNGGEGIQWMSTVLALCLTASSALAVGPPEKTEVQLAFIKLTDMAPLAVAEEKGYFEDEGLDVVLESKPSWGQLLDEVVNGVVDGAHMLAGQPLAARAGYGSTQGHIVTPLSLDRNGNAITVSNDTWEAMLEHVAKRDDGKPAHPIGAEALKPVIEAYKDRGETFNLGMVFPVSSHNYELRYWLAAGGVHPGYYDGNSFNAVSRAGWVDADVRLYVAPPPQMPTMLERGRVSGYCVGEPWNQSAVIDGLGVAVVTDNQIWKDNPEKVFGMTAEFVERNPNTAVRLVRALLRAAKWLDEGDHANRAEAVALLSKPEYVGAKEEVLSNSMTGTFEFEKGDKRPAPDFNVFFGDFATYPYYSDAVWYLTQMRRWGQIAEAKPDEWYFEVAQDVYRPDIYATAAKSLIADGHMSASDFPDFESETGFRAPQGDFIDGVVFNGREPNTYLRSFSVGQKD